MELGVAYGLELGNYLVRFNRQDLAREKQSLRLFGIIAPRWGILVGPGIDLKK
jgi:hypothetical protein